MPDTPRQRRTVGRVMREFKQGELKRSEGGKGGKVKSRRQAIAIALSEAGESHRQSPSRNARNAKRTQRKEARGETAQQQREGRGAMRADGYTRGELYARAQRKRIAGRSRMSKQQLKDALGLR